MDIQPIRGTPEPTPPGSVSEEALAKEFKGPLLQFIDVLKNLSPATAQSDATLSTLSQSITKLHEAAQKATEI